MTFGGFFGAMCGWFFATAILNLVQNVKGHRIAKEKRITYLEWLESSHRQMLYTSIVRTLHLEWYANSSLAYKWSVFRSIVQAVLSFGIPLAILIAYHSGNENITAWIDAISSMK